MYFLSRIRCRSQESQRPQKVVGYNARFHPPRFLIKRNINLRLICSRVPSKLKMPPTIYFTSIRISNERATCWIDPQARDDIGEGAEVAARPLRVAEHVLRSAALQIPLLRQEGSWHDTLRLRRPGALLLFAFFPFGGILQTTEEEKMTCRIAQRHTWQWDIHIGNGFTVNLTFYWKGSKIDFWISARTKYKCRRSLRGAHLFGKTVVRSRDSFVPRMGRFQKPELHKLIIKVCNG